MKKIRLIGRSLLTLVILAGVTVPNTIAIAETVDSTVATVATSETGETATSEIATDVPTESTDTSISENTTVESTSTEETTEESISQAETGNIEEEKRAEETTIPVQLLGINDFHGALSTTGTAHLGSGSHSGAGTAALLASHLKAAETAFQTDKTNATTLRVQSGDMVGASPANSGLLQDQPTMRILNQMNFDVGTLGNHEFDEGLAEFNRILLGQAPTAEDNFYPIVYDYNKEHGPEILKGGFDLAIANVVEKNTGAIPFGWQPYSIKTVGTGDESAEIAFIGVVTTEIPNLVLREHHINYDFLDPAETIAKYAKELQEEKNIDAIVVLSHTASEQSGENGVVGEAATIMQKVKNIYPGNSVDAFFAGHNHVYTNGVVDQTRIVQSTSQGKAFIDLQGEINLETGDFTDVPTATVDPVMPTIEPDAEVEAIVAEADEIVAQVTEQKIGTAATAEDISRSTNELGESPVGNLITDGQVFMAKLNGIDADFAMTNNGGVRADLAVDADRSITWGAAQTVQPFGNIMQIVEMTGAQIRTVLNQQTFGTKLEGGRAYFLQVSGLNYTVTDNPDTTDLEHPFVVHQMMESDGTPIEENQTYNVVINDFLFGGGDGFAGFRDAIYKDAMQPDTETFVNYIKTLESMGKEISASVEGRKTYKSAEEIQNEAIAKIKEATSFEQVKEGDTYLVGKTLASAKINVSKISKQKAVNPIISASADENGSVQLDIQSLQFIEGNQLLVTVTDANGYTAEFSQTIVAATIATTDSSDSTDDSTSTTSSNDSTTATSTSTSKGNTNSEKNLPKTGETRNAALTLLGVLFLGAGGYLIYRKKAA